MTSNSSTTTPAFTSLIFVDELAKILANDNLVILDASIPPVGAMHLPEHIWPKVSITGAQFFDIETKFSALDAPFPHTVPTAKQFEQHAKALGINSDSQIVVYDHYGIFSSARAWWLFKAMGHQQVAVLNGGLPAWLKTGYPIEPADEAFVAKIGNFAADYQPDYFCDYHYLLENLSSDNVCCLDARASNRFLAQVAEPRAGVRSGHIPHSKNLPFTTLLNEHGLRPEVELSQILSRLVSKEQQLVMSCGSGITACILALAAEISGYTDVRVYDGSWAEWGALAQLPIIQPAS